MAAEIASSRAVRPLERGHAWDARFYEKNPLFWPLKARASVFENHLDWPSIAEIDAAWFKHTGIHFHEQPPRPRRRRRGRRLPIDTESLYDSQIANSGSVPTRPRNWHDYLNALVWATFPHAKRRFHERQHHAVTARIQAGDRVLPGARTRELDGLAILDEGGMLMVVEPELEQQMAQWIDEKNLDQVGQAIRERRALTLLFGHALYETLLGDNAAATWAMVTLLPVGVPPPGVVIVNVASRHLAARISDPENFSNPDTFRNLPLDADLLFAPLNP